MWSFFLRHPVLLLICLIIKLQKIVTDLSIQGKKLHIYFVFIIKSYFAITKYVRLNSTHFYFKNS